MLSYDAFSRGIIRKDNRGTRIFARLIVEMACDEMETLEAKWIERNPKAAPYLQRAVCRRMLRELLAFYVCVTARFTARHALDNSNQFIDAVADEVREIMSVDPWPRPSRKDAAEIQAQVAWFNESHITWLRERFPYREPEPILAPELLTESATGVTFRLCCASPGERDYDKVFPVIVRRLQQRSGVLFKSPPFLALAAGVPSI